MKLYSYDGNFNCMNIVFVYGKQTKSSSISTLTSCSNLQYVLKSWKIIRAWIILNIKKSLTSQDNAAFYGENRKTYFSVQLLLLQLWLLCQQLQNQSTIAHWQQILRLAVHRLKLSLLSSEMFHVQRYSWSSVIKNIQMFPPFGRLPWSYFRIAPRHPLARLKGN